MSVKCEICSKEFKTTQGLKGHKNFVHDRNTAEELPTQMTTEERLGDLEEFVKEFVIQTARIPELLRTYLDLIKHHDGINGSLITLLQDMKSKCGELDSKTNRCRTDVELLDKTIQRVSRFVQ